MESKIENPLANPVIGLRQEFDEWGLLYNPDTSDSMAISPVGVVIWKLLDGKHTIPDIVAEVKIQCEDAPETVQEDVVTFIQSLQARGYLENPIEVPPQATN